MLTKLLNIKTNRVTNCSNNLIDISEKIVTSLPIQYWLEKRFDRAILILGDTTEFLIPFSRFSLVYRFNSLEIVGIGVLFKGFSRPILSIVSDDFRATDALIHYLGRDSNAILSISTQQVLPTNISSKPCTFDRWMVSQCFFEPKYYSEISIAPLYDEKELLEFYCEQGLGFWCKEMLCYGHTFGIRNSEGKLVSVGGVNFILPQFRYAQIGGLVTHVAYRRRSYATYILNTIRVSLARTGIKECGLFVDSCNSNLVAFYLRRGFLERGGYRFF